MRAVLGAALAVALLVLTGCSSDDPEQPSAEQSQAAAVAWSPCDGLTADAVAELVGEPVNEVDGSADQPRCTFTPQRKGGAAYDLSYLWFDGGLDAALTAMGAAGSQLEPIDVPGADAARIVVDARGDDGMLVTGFVQTGGLVQSVNAVQLAPYDEQAVVAATKALLGELAAKAPDSP
ncbi:DUF3558 domain-containing protein [Nocardioides sp. MAH-18]|uniref:DUF3558 domain-containing protein n=1 Tax=Nocardioides agri TaxID=2682843 RepID=A0A6L6XVZ4_9ACTN|nr:MULTISPECIES: DUF3558 family protein [unclassified Nocardioides]MBA2954871.1 DUF3558 family protein [Nocardioides sp. CGMCC 1.13656]MVQ49725.1 DUF3558 domain-containing protein [Nocardioides sp. MAH-18]